MKVGENFIQHTCFRLERGQEKSACRVSFILVLHVKIAVIQSLRKADYGGASLDFAIFIHFVSIQKQQTQMTVILQRFDLIGADMILQKHLTRSIEECLSLIYLSLVLNCTLFFQINTKISKTELNFSSRFTTLHNFLE